SPSAARNASGRSTRSGSSSTAARSDKDRTADSSMNSVMTMSAISGAAIKFRHTELAVTERLCRRQPPVGGPPDNIDQRLARLVNRHLAEVPSRESQGE